MDMDRLVKVHKQFMNMVVRRCMLDQSLKSLKKEITNVMESALDFRRIIKKYLLAS